MHFELLQTVKQKKERGEDKIFHYNSCQSMTGGQATTPLSLSVCLLLPFCSHLNGPGNFKEDKH